MSTRYRITIHRDGERKGITVTVDGFLTICLHRRGEHGEMALISGTDEGATMSTQELVQAWRLLARYLMELVDADSPVAAIVAAAAMPHTRIGSMETLDDGHEHKPGGHRR